MFSSHKVRLNRFLAADGRCLDVAIDHGVFNEHAFLDGLEDMPAVVRSLVEAGPDAIQMNIGQADVLQTIRGHANLPSCSEPTWATSTTQPRTR